MLATLVVVPASAQTTDCSLLGNNVTCRERGGGVPDYGAIMDSAQSSMPDYRENERREAVAREARERAAALREASAAAARSEKLHRSAGALVAESKCTEAEAVALKGGDLDLAAKVRSYCASK